MSEQFKGQAWVLALLAAAAFIPALYIWRYFAHSPSRRDVTLFAEDLSWRTPRRLTVNLVMLAAIAAVAVFILTPWRAELVEAPIFFPALMAGMGAWAIGTVAWGYRVGRIEPIVEGVHRKYERDAEPRRFWASMVWNGLFGCFCLWLAGAMFIRGPGDALQARCSGDGGTAQDQLAACNQLLAKTPEGRARADLIGARATAYHRAGDFQRAMGDYTDAIGLDPGEFSHHYNRGLLDRDMGDARWALEDFDAAFAIRADHSGAYVYRGTAYLDLGRLDEALSDLSRAHELAPKDPWPLANRGLAYAWKNDRARAERDFAAARAIDPANTVVLRGEAVLGIKSGDPAEVVRKTTAALAQDAKDKWSLENRIVAYLQLGEWDKAKADRARLNQLAKDQGPP